MSEISKAFIVASMTMNLRVRFRFRIRERVSQMMERSLRGEKSFAAGIQTYFELQSLKVEYSTTDFERYSTSLDDFDLNLHR